MDLEEAKKILLILQDEIEFKLQFEINEKLKEYSKAIEIAIAELHALQNLVDEKNDEIEHLQKENEELRKLEKDHNYSVQVIIENSKLRYELAHSVNCEKIREKIEEIKNKPNNPNQKVVATQIDASLIALMHDLLKEE